MLKRFFTILIILIGVVPVFSQQDIWKPDIPFLDSVSVDFSNLNGDVFVGWEPSDSLDVMGYYIYRNDGTTSNFYAIDSVFGRMVTSYIDYTADAEFHSEGYRIAAFDSSHNFSALSTKHFTVYSFPYAETTNCQFHVRLAWNNYVGWSSSISHYNIYRDENSSGTMVLIGTVPSTQTFYVDTNVIDNSSYCYYVRAIGNNGFSSSSNQTCRVVDIPNNPQFIVSLNASIETENHVSLKFLVDTSAQNISEYQILRSDSLTGTYNPITTISFSTNPEQSFIDIIPSDKEKYFYKIVAFNACNQQIIESNIVSNIVISVLNNGDLQHALYWENFYQWLGSIQNFELHRIDDETDEVIVNSTYSMNNFVDDISNIPFSEHFYSGKFCYYIRYFENNNNPYGYQSSSRSNLVCTQEFSRVFMPTAFRPLSPEGSVNSIFKPSLLFISPDNYYFAIFNRWGENIFETKDPNEGWNGKSKCCNYSPSGKYIYILNYQDANGDIHKLSGTFFSFQ